ncbi:MAG: SRPBCC domain-containing protein [Xanthobacteraceae bacterium]
MIAPARSTLPAGGELIIKRVLNAPRERVFEAWTDPALAVKWWGPKDYPATFLEMDVRVGGTWSGRLRATADGRELTHRGVFREIVEPSLLIFTFAWDEEGERGLETIVTLTFTDLGGRTLLTLHQTPFQSAEERDGHQSGWNSAFDRLEDSLV